MYVKDGVCAQRGAEGNPAVTVCCGQDQRHLTGVRQKTNSLPSLASIVHITLH